MKIWPPLGLCYQIAGKPDENVPLLNCTATADIADDDAGVKLVQYFSNPSFGSNNDQEAVYKFPLIGDAAVYHFKSSYLSDSGDILKTLIGKAKEKQEAREEYEQAKANGKAAQLLEVDYENSPDLFVMSLGNIPSNCKSVHVEIAYHCPLQTEEKGVVKRFTLPAVLAGRYGKQAQSAFNGPNVTSNEAMFNFQGNICLGNYIASLESPSHKITSKLMVDGTPNKATVSFEQALQEDLVLKISSGDAPKSSLLVQAPESIPNESFAVDFPDTTLAKLTFNCAIAELEDAEVKKNFVFVVDRSGSMSGASIRECKKALLLCLASLPEESCFDICSFGSRFDFLFGGKSQDYSADTLQQARAHVESMTANYGGTEILKPLQEIVKAITDIPTVVFLLTDGQVYNTAEIVKLIKKEHEKSGTTLFSCGIGSGVDRNLVDGLAKAGGGTATYIAYGEKMNAKLAAQMEQAIEPPCINLKVELGPLRLSPSKLSWNPVSALPGFAYSGQRVDCYLALDSNSVLETRKLLESNEEVLNVTLTGKVNIEGKEHTVVVAQADLKTNFHETNTNLVVPAFRQQITLTEKSLKEKKSAKKRAVKFAVAANIVTKYTSLVAVEEGNEKNAQESQVEVTKKELPVPEAPQFLAKMMAPPVMSSRPAPALPRSDPRALRSAPGPVPGMAVNSTFTTSNFYCPPPAPPSNKALPIQEAEQKRTLGRKKKSNKGGGMFKKLAKMGSKMPKRKKREKFDDMDLAPIGRPAREERAMASPPSEGDFEMEEMEEEISFGAAGNFQSMLASPPMFSSQSEARDIDADMMLDLDISPKARMRKMSLPTPVLKPKVALVTDDDKLNALISLQAMNGSFELTESLKDIIGKVDFGADEKTTGFATALAIKFMEIKLGALSAEWKLIHKKSMKWLKKNSLDHKAVLALAAKHI